MAILSILIHPQRDARFLERVAGQLETAVKVAPESFDKVKDVPGTIDHYGFHNDTLSAVVMSKESAPSIFWRLTVRPGLHPVFDNLAAMIVDYMLHGENN